MPPERANAPAPIPPLEAAKPAPFFERKIVWVPLAVIILLGGGVYFISQNAPSETAPAAQESTAETELWVVTTKVKINPTVFITNAESDREKYESSYAKVVSLYMPMPVGLKIWDSKVSSTDASIFFVTAIDQQGLEYAYILNSQQKTVTKLFSSVEYPDFKLAAISGLSPDNSAIRFHFVSCRDCGGVTVGEAVYNISKKVYKNIGLTSAFRWTANGNFEYKPVLEGCDKMFHTGGLCDFYGWGPDEIAQCKTCRDNAEDASWIQGSWE